MMAPPTSRLPGRRLSLMKGPSKEGVVTATLTSAASPHPSLGSASAPLEASSAPVASAVMGRADSVTSHHFEAIADIKRVLDHESSSLYQHSLLQSDSPRSAAQAMGQLDKVLDELLATEANYALDLHSTCERVLRPLQTILPAGTHARIFSNLQAIRTLHSHLQETLSSAASRADSVAEKGEAVVAGFMAAAAKFACYARYSANYPYVATAIHKARAGEERVVRLIDDAERALGASLQALLFRPLQRVCVYPLLFQRALQHVPRDGELHARMQRAFTMSQHTVHEMNEQVRSMEAQLKMLRAFTHEVTGAPPAEEFLAPDRFLVAEAMVAMKSRDRRAASSNGAKVIDVVQWGVRRDYKWYLFSDVLLICQPSRFGGRPAVKEIFQLSSLVATPSQASVDPPTPRRTISEFPRRASAMTSPRSRSLRKGSLSGPGGGGDDALEKPEVLRLQYEGVEYKCWAASKEDMLHLVAKVTEQQEALREKLHADDALGALSLGQLQNGLEASEAAAAATAAAAAKGFRRSVSARSVEPDEDRVEAPAVAVAEAPAATEKKATPSERLSEHGVLIAPMREIKRQSSNGAGLPPTVGVYTPPWMATSAASPPARTQSANSLTPRRGSLMTLPSEKTARMQVDAQVFNGRPAAFSIEARRSFGDAPKAVPTIITKEGSYDDNGFACDVYDSFDPSAFTRSRTSTCSMPQRLGDRGYEPLRANSSRRSTTDSGRSSVRGLSSAEQHEVEGSSSDSDAEGGHVGGACGEIAGAPAELPTARVRLASLGAQSLARSSSSDGECSTDVRQTWRRASVELPPTEDADESGGESDDTEVDAADSMEAAAANESRLSAGGVADLFGCSALNKRRSDADGGFEEEESWHIQKMTSFEMPTLVEEEEEEEEEVEKEEEAVSDDATEVASSDDGGEGLALSLDDRMALAKRCAGYQHLCSCCPRFSSAGEAGSIRSHRRSSAAASDDTEVACSRRSSMASTCGRTSTEDHPSEAPLGAASPHSLAPADRSLDDNRRLSAPTPRPRAPPPAPRPPPPPPRAASLVSLPTRSEPRLRGHEAAAPAADGSFAAAPAAPANDTATAPSATAGDAPIRSSPRRASAARATQLQAESAAREAAVEAAKATEEELLLRTAASRRQSVQRAEAEREAALKTAAAEREAQSSAAAEREAARRLSAVEREAALHLLAAEKEAELQAAAAAERAAAVAALEKAREEAVRLAAEKEAVLQATEARTAALQAAYEREAAALRAAAEEREAALRAAAEEREAALRAAAEEKEAALRAARLREEALQQAAAEREAALLAAAAKQEAELQQSVTRQSELRAAAEREISLLRATEREARQLEKVSAEHDEALASVAAVRARAQRADGAEREAALAELAAYEAELQLARQREAECVAESSAREAELAQLRSEREASADALLALQAEMGALKARAEAEKREVEQGSELLLRAAVEQQGQLEKERLHVQKQLEEARVREAELREAMEREREQAEQKAAELQVASAREVEMMRRSLEAELKEQARLEAAAQAEAARRQALEEAAEREAALKEAAAQEIEAQKRAFHAAVEKEAALREAAEREAETRAKEALQLAGERQVWLREEAERDAKAQAEAAHREALRLAGEREETLREEAGAAAQLELRRGEAVQLEEGIEAALPKVKGEAAAQPQIPRHDALQLVEEKTATLQEANREATGREAEAGDAALDTAAEREEALRAVAEREAAARREVELKAAKLEEELRVLMAREAQLREEELRAAAQREMELKTAFDREVAARAEAARRQALEEAAEREAALKEAAAQEIEARERAFRAAVEKETALRQAAEREAEARMEAARALKLAEEKAAALKEEMEKQVAREEEARKQTLTVGAEREATRRTVHNSVGTDATAEECEPAATRTNQVEAQFDNSAERQMKLQAESAAREAAVEAAKATEEELLLRTAASRRQSVRQAEAEREAALKTAAAEREAQSSAAAEREAARRLSAVEREAALHLLAAEKEAELQAAAAAERAAAVAALEKARAEAVRLAAEKEAVLQATEARTAALQAAYEREAAALRAAAEEREAALRAAAEEREAALRAAAEEKEAALRAARLREEALQQAAAEREAALLAAAAKQEAELRLALEKQSELRAAAEREEALRAAAVEHRAELHEAERREVELVNQVRDEASRRQTAERMVAERDARDTLEENATAQSPYFNLIGEGCARVEPTVSIRGSHANHVCGVGLVKSSTASLELRVLTSRLIR
ncbi:hypothetical protein AB1Y20_015439 [Prymnesium parvum]|uniref:DH domain-containing protein n=1 Tax=Prymnesium parvum TaxID=97485 RepID=A0AB34JX67_PRYPA